MVRQREKEEGRMQCFMKKEDKSLIDEEHVETTYFDNSVSLPHLPPFLSHLSQSCFSRILCNLKALPHVTISSTISSTMVFNVAKIASARASSTAAWNAHDKKQTPDTNCSITNQLLAD